MAEKDLSSIVADALQSHRAALRRFVASRTDAGQIDDVMQAAALRALERADGLREPERVLGWLLRIHANVAMDAGRHAARHQSALEAYGFEDPWAKDDTQDLCECSVTHARSLAETHAAIIDLVDITGLSVTKATEALNITVNTASVRLHRARAALRKRLEDSCGVTGMRACLDCDCTPAAQ